MVYSEYIQESKDLYTKFLELSKEHGVQKIKKVDMDDLFRIENLDTKESLQSAWQQTRRIYSNLGILVSELEHIYTPKYPVELKYKIDSLVRYPLENTATKVTRFLNEQIDYMNGNLLEKYEENIELFNDNIIRVFHSLNEIFITFLGIIEENEAKEN